jgi:hypothetical protein
MTNNFNIYERLDNLESENISLKDELSAFIDRVKRLEEIVSLRNKPEFYIDPNLEHFCTIDDITRKYGISEQTFYRFKKIAHLKSAGKQGKKMRYNNKNVISFFKEIERLKISNPELFRFEIKRAS